MNTGLYHGVKQLFSFQRTTSNGWTQLDKNSTSNLFYSLDAPLNGGNTNIYGTFIYNSSAGLVNQLMPVDLLHEFGDRYQFPPSTYIKQNDSTNFSVIAGVTQQITPILSVDLKGFVNEQDYVRTSFSSAAGAGIYPLPDSGGTARDHHQYGYYTNTFGVQPSVKLVLPFNTLQAGANLTIAHLHSREFFANFAPVPNNPGPNGNDFWDEHDYRTFGSVYLQDDISLLDDKLKITPGIKYLWAETKDHDDQAFYYAISGSASNYAHYLSPTLGASYEILPGLDAYGAYGQTIRFPDITAYYGNISVFDPNGNPVNEPTHTQPEHVDDYEAGLRYESGGFTAEANYYLENLKNSFVTTTDPVTGVSFTSNGGKSRYSGEELQLGDDFGSIFSAVVPGDFAGYLNYSHNNAYQSNYVDPVSGNDTSGRPIANVPTDLISAGASWAYNNYFVSVDTHYIGSQYVTLAYSSNASTSKNGGYFLTNLVLKDSVPVNFGPTKAVVLSLNIDNLFGVRYYTQADINQDSNGNYYKEAIVGAPRAVYGSVAIRF